MGLSFLRRWEPAPNINLKRLTWAGIGAAILLALAVYPVYVLFDKSGTTWALAHTYAWRDTFLFTAFKQLGKSWPFLLVLFVWAIVGKGKRALLVTMLALVIASVSVAVIKEATQRVRPGEVMVGHKSEPGPTPFADLSFPSGDAAATFAIAFALVPFLGAPWRVALFVIAAAVSVGRVFSLKHYPSDVTAGAALGILCALTALALHQWWERRKARMIDAAPEEPPS